jgi:hypothetical protein
MPISTSAKISPVPPPITTAQIAPRTTRTAAEPNDMTRAYLLTHSL